VNSAYPPCTDLERLLADRLSDGEEKALEDHVADCAACQLQLEQLTGNGQTLVSLPPVPFPGPEDAPVPAGALERVAHFLPAQIRLLTEPHPPERETSAARDPASVSSSADAADPIVKRPEVTPADPVSILRRPKSEYQRSTDHTPDPTNQLNLQGISAVQTLAFGRYQVRRVLGAGGFATVYLSHDSQLDRPVAIKVFRGPAVPKTESDALLQEARRLARLRHPGIVTVHDVGVQEGRVYIVSDFLDGPSLEEWLRSARPGWHEAGRLAAAVADALAHAHTRSIVHRDVKPANILLIADRTPVLVDFGLALDETQAAAVSSGLSPAPRSTCRRSKW
jgi:hypothetical protein